MCEQSAIEIARTSWTTIKDMFTDLKLRKCFHYKTKSTIIIWILHAPLTEQPSNYSKIIKSQGDFDFKRTFVFFHVRFNSCNQDKVIGQVNTAFFEIIVTHLL
jgi:hypothetical protein